MIENWCNCVRSRYVRAKCTEIIGALIRQGFDSRVCALRLSWDAAQRGGWQRPFDTLSRCQRPQQTWSRVVTVACYPNRYPKKITWMHLRHHPVLLMIIIREAISHVSKVSTDETKHFLICIMIFSLSPSERATTGVAECIKWRLSPSGLGFLSVLPHRAGRIPFGSTSWRLNIWPQRNIRND